MKTIIIKSPMQLWSLLKNKEHIFEVNKDIKRFIYMTEKNIKGCNCGNTDNEMLMNNTYKVLKESDIAINLIKKELDLENLLFED
jgi:hypothetical protein